MPAPYNLTNLTTSETLYDLVKFSNEVNGGITGIIFVISIFLILLLVLKRYPFEQAITAASFSSFFIGIILVSTKLVSIIFILVYALILATVITLSYIMRNK